MRRLMAYLSYFGLGRHPELLLAIGIGGILGLLVVPVPVTVLDVLLATNMAFAGLILAAVLLSERPLSISTFPTLVVISTLFRVGLNVSTTRSILSFGTAGDVVFAFGQFVAHGDFATGFVVFLVLTLVQLMVIGKGAERVAEVGARFALDAMPGKQMSIDAAIRGGAITEEEAEARRAELNRESQFYGAMDGAMKFVKGDAMLGIVVTALNLIAGLAVGVFRFDMTFIGAVETFALLTIGDGLVSQMPSLLVALSAGVITTRVASRVPHHDLGRTLGAELISNPKVLALAGGFAIAVGLIPGMPTLPFAAVGGAVALGAGLLRWRPSTFGPVAAETGDESGLEHAFAERRKMAAAQKAVSDQLAPTVPVLGVDLGDELSTRLGFGRGQDDRTALMVDWIGQVRDAVFGETGVRLPGVRVKSFVPGLGPNQAVFRVKDVPVSTAAVRPARAFAFASTDELRRLGVDAEPADNPVSAAPASTFDPHLTVHVRPAGIQVLCEAGVVAIHLLQVARRHLFELIGLQETAESLARLEKVCPELVRELVPKVVTVAQLRDVLRQLVRERVSIRDLKSILEGLGEHGAHIADIVTLTEHVRRCLSLQLTHQLAGPSLRLGVVVLEPVVEAMIEDAIVTVPSGGYLALEPELQSALLQGIAKAFQPIQRTGVAAVLITRARIRHYVHALLEVQGSLSSISVVSYDELRNDLIIQPLGCVRVEPSAPLMT